MDGGFITMTFPAVSAGPILRQASASGKFHAAIPTVTP
jgi:hypothetical protein